MFTTAPPKPEDPSRTKYNFFNIGKNSEMIEKQQHFKEVQYFGQKPREKKVSAQEQKYRA